MSRNKPPFRADVVGSLLRTARLKEARGKRDKGEINAAQLKEVEDREIETIIKKQKEVGLQVATDGEFRRSFWHFDFFGMLDGVETCELDHGIQFHGVQSRATTIRINGQIGFSDHPMIEHFKFLKATPALCRR
jgi:5-methyltetrahydropteroyltriglutamate--homocysteine methyltransferase